MSRKKSKIVTLRPMGNRKDLSKEPEMTELKRMVRGGELDRQRTIDQLKKKEKNK